MIGTLNILKVLAFGLIFLKKPGYLHQNTVFLFYFKCLCVVQIWCRCGADGADVVQIRPRFLICTKNTFNKINRLFKNGAGSR